MKNNPFPQAQMLDSQGVLHEWHGAVHNPSGNSFAVDNLLKSIAIRAAPRVVHRCRAQALPGFCADLAQPPAAAAAVALRRRHNLQNR